MTEMEKRLHRAKLLLEIEDAESEFAYSRDQVVGMAEALEEVAEQMRRNAGLQPGPADFTAESDVANRLTPEQIADFPTTIALSSKIETLKRVRQRVFNLEKRKDGLSVLRNTDRNPS